MTGKTKTIIRQLWLWIRLDYEGVLDSPDETDNRNFGYDLKYRDIRLAAEELGIKPR